MNRPRSIDSLPDRVATRIEITEEGCWLWKGSIQAKGYPVAKKEFLDGLAGYVHRYVWLQLVGPIPDGLVLDHLCRVRHCVNPDHLEPVTSRENTLRGLLGRLKTHCGQGHEFTPETTEWIRRPSGYRGRRCRICSRNRNREWERLDRARKRAERAA